MQKYNHEESRDLWEYHLNLPPEEIPRLLEHLWELNQVRFDYYYLDENCSYRLLELLAVLRPNVDWATDLRFAELPIDTISKVKEQGLIAKVAYPPLFSVKFVNNLPLCLTLILPASKHYKQNLSALKASVLANSPKPYDRLFRLSL